MKNLNVIVPIMIDKIYELPFEQQQLEFFKIKDLIVAWDKDFSKLTPKEANELADGLLDNDLYDLNDINWN